MSLFYFLESSKAFAHVRNCLLKKKTHGTNQNTDGLYTKTTEKGGFNKLRVKIEKDVILTYSFFNTYSKHNLVSFFGRIVF